MKREIKIYINDIYESILKIEEYKKGLNYSDFISNIKIQDAIIRRLEIIGEAAKNIPQEMRNQYNTIPWQEVAGLRDVLIHEYFGVNYQRIWQVIEEDINQLKETILIMLEDLKTEEKENS